MASSIKQSVGTPLRDVDALDPEARSRLAAVSVTTAEELLGLIAADAQGTQRLLGLDNLAPLQAAAGFVASASSTPSLDEAPQETYWTGAAVPDGVEPAEVSLDEVLQRAPSAGELDAEAGPTDAGTSFLDCFSALRDQGHRGTCVAHAVCALVECLERRQGADLDLSEQYLYWDAKQNDGRPESEGTHIAVAMDRMTKDGTCPESAWPYNPEPEAGNESQAPPPAGAQEAAGSRVPGGDDLRPGGLDAIRQALDDQRPVALSVPVFANWKGNPMLKLSGLIPMPLPGSGFDGGHAMCAAGYGRDEEFTGGGYLILRNSWGSGFAPSSPVAPGHALLPFAYWEAYGWEAFAATR